MQRRILRELFLPLANLAASLFQDPLADGNNQAGLFGDIDELVRRDESAFRVMPAYQSFKATDGSRLKSDNRLVMKDKLFALDGTAQVCLHLQKIHGEGVHGLVEDLVTRFAQHLRAIHSGVRVAQNLFGTVVAGAAQRDADADGCEDFVAVEIEGQGEGLLKTLGHFNRFGDVAQVFKQDCKLIATQTRHSVAGTQADFQTSGDSDQQLISDHMAQAVVDNLEAVKVEEQDGEHLVRRALRARDGKLEVVYEERAIG